MLKDASKIRKEELSGFLKNLGLNIKNFTLLNTALTHGSYIKESTKEKLQDNERLEFFGDAVLKLYISEYLMNRYTDYTEGELSNLRAYVVSEKVLTKVADRLNIKKYLLLGKGERKSLPNSILADSVEALLAVIYYECGPDKVQEFILKNWLHFIESADRNKEKENFKAVLQEYTQGNKLGLPLYKTLSEVGPEHKKEFEVAVYVNNREFATGKGKTKKDASQNAAKSALISLSQL